jgi:hypothetical protein
MFIKLNIDKVKRLFEENRGQNATSIERTSSIADNLTYKITSNKNNFILVIKKDNNEDNQIITAALLESTNQLQVRLLSRGHDSQRAPYGYLLSRTTKSK